jgi:hypothetical protein
VLLTNARPIVSDVDMFFLILFLTNRKKKFQTSTQHTPNKLSLNGIEFIFIRVVRSEREKKRKRNICRASLFRLKEAKRIFQFD